MTLIPPSVKWSYISRRVEDSSACTLAPVHADTQLGDLVAAKVVSMGNHTHIEDSHGRRCRLYVGDLLVGAFGNRYASDYYEGFFTPGTTAHLLSASGLIGSVAATHSRYADPTVLEIVAAVADGKGSALSLEAFARPAPAARRPRYGTWVVVGSAMNAGKTTTTSAIARGWTKARICSGAGKVTGTGSGKDLWAYMDAGATHVCDFLDFGIASTYGYPIERLQGTMISIRDALVADGAEAVVLEIADGLLQPETRGLLSALRDFADTLILAVGDPLAAKSGSEILRKDYDLPLRAISGLITASPLASREAGAITGLPVVPPQAFADGAAADLLMAERAVA